MTVVSGVACGEGLSCQSRIADVVVHGEAKQAHNHQLNGIIAERLICSFPNVIEIGARPFRQSVLGHGVRIIRMQAEPPEMGSYQ